MKAKHVFYELMHVSSSSSMRYFGRLRTPIFLPVTRNSPIVVQTINHLLGNTHDQYLYRG
jgi:hypothetical protein